MTLWPKPKALLQQFATGKQRTDTKKVYVLFKQESNGKNQMLNGLFEKKGPKASYNTYVYSM